jgi:hypothetical protein
VRTATAELDPVDTAVLAIARGESTRLPAARPPVLGIPNRDGGYGWILGQFALLGHTDIVRNLLDAGMAVDTRGWSNFTPLDQAAMHGRAETVRLLIERGANLHDAAFDTHGPTPPWTAPCQALHRMPRRQQQRRAHGRRPCAAYPRCCRCRNPALAGHCRGYSVARHESCHDRADEITDPSRYGSTEDRQSVHRSPSS